MCEDAPRPGFRVLYILPQCPTPAQNGPAHLTAGLLRVAVQHLQCEVVGFAADAAERARWRAFEQAIPGVVLLRVFARNRGARRLAGRALRGLRGRPVSMATFDSTAAHQWLRAEASKQNWDLIHFDTFNVAEYLADVGDLPSVLVPYDAFSVGARLGMAASTHWRDRARFWFQASTYERFEAREYRSFGVVAPVAEPDAQWLARIDPRMNVTAIQFPLGPEYVPRARSTSRRAPRIVVPGLFTNPAVGAGLEEFLRELYPTILKRLPSAHLTIWGRIAPNAPARFALRLYPEIAHVDYVDDYVAFLRSFDLVLYPQRYGVGVQTKVQQAMASGVAVVARPNVLRGLGAQHGVHAYGHEDNDGFAASAVSLAEDAALRLRIADQGAEFIRLSAEPDHVWSRLWAVYRAAVATSGATPQQAAP